ncbi:Transient receptor putative cation channel sub A member 1, partial [Nowakowskiella sp. JEL0407]
PFLILRQIFNYIETPEHFIQTCKYVKEFGDIPIVRFGWLERNRTFLDTTKFLLEKPDKLMNAEVCLLASQSNCSYRTAAAAFKNSIELTFLSTLKSFISGESPSIKTCFLPNNLRNTLALYGTALLQSFSKSNFTILQKILDSPFAVNHLNKYFEIGPPFPDNHSPIIYAVESGLKSNYPLFPWLEKIVAFIPNLVNCSRKGPHTPLSFAIEYNNLAIVKTILKQHEKIDFTTRPNAMLFIQACQMGNTELVKLLLPIFGPDDRFAGITSPLHVSAWYPEIVEMLLNYDPAPIFEPLDSTERTPLHYAVQYPEQWPSTKLLIDAGCSVSARDSKGITPLNIAAKAYDDLRNIEIMIEKYPDALIDLQVREDVNTPLFDAVSWCNTKIVEFMLKNGANPDVDGGSRSERCSALVKSVHKQSYEICMGLLEYGVDPNKLSKYNRENITALHLACKLGDFQIVEGLLAYGANPVVLDGKGQTSIHVAALEGDLTILEILINGIPNARAKHIREKCSARFSGGRVLPKPFYETESIVRIDVREFIDLKDWQGNIALMNSVCGVRVNPKVPQLLLENGADINQQNEIGETVLHIAARLKRYKHITMLLRYEPDLTLVDMKGNTAVSLMRVKRVPSSASFVSTESD